MRTLSPAKENLAVKMRLIELLSNAGGQALFNITRLARTLDVGRQLLRTAIKQLVTAGVLFTRNRFRGGTFIGFSVVQETDKSEPVMVNELTDKTVVDNRQNEGETTVKQVSEANDQPTEVTDNSTDTPYVGLNTLKQEHLSKKETKTNNRQTSRGDSRTWYLLRGPDGHVGSAGNNYEKLKALFGVDLADKSNLTWVLKFAWMASRSCSPEIIDTVIDVVKKKGRVGRARFGSMRRAIQNRYSDFEADIRRIHLHEDFIDERQQAIITSQGRAVAA